MTRTGERASQPRPLEGQICFEEGDFHALSDGLSKDPQFNDRRLLARRRLGALAHVAVARAKEADAALESRTSLHNPHTFNGMRVRRIWAYICRAKAEKTKLKRVLGADLAKDLDAAYRNAYLCLAIEADALEVSLRIHPDAWYDGQNLIKRVAAEGVAPWREILNELGGFRLKMHDWKGEWRCGDLTTEALEEFLSYYVPGEHTLAVEHRLPAPPGARGAAIEPVTAEAMVTECMRLLPLYRFTAWSKDSDFLFS